MCRVYYEASSWAKSVSEFSEGSREGVDARERGLVFKSEE